MTPLNDLDWALNELAGDETRGKVKLHYAASESFMEKQKMEYLKEH